MRQENSQRFVKKRFIAEFQIRRPASGSSPYMSAAACLTYPRCDDSQTKMVCGSLKMPPMPFLRPGVRTPKLHGSAAAKIQRMSLASRFTPTKRSPPVKGMPLPGCESRSAIRLMSLHGLSHDAGLIYESRKLGLQIALRFKYNLTDAVAAIGLRQLVRSEESCPERINR